MKPAETVFGAKKKYVAIMLLCLIYGGFSMVMFLSQAYSFFWRSEVLGIPSLGPFPESGPRDSNFRDLNSGSPNFSDMNSSARDIRAIERSAELRGNPAVFLSSPNSLFLLAGGVISFLAGIAIWALTREKEIKNIKQHVATSLLLPDERKVIDALKASGYELAQSRIVKATGLSKVQVHRAVKRLESKGVLEKHDYGLTNKIILKREFFE